MLCVRFTLTCICIFWLILCRECCHAYYLSGMSNLLQIPSNLTMLQVESMAQVVWIHGSGSSNLYQTAFIHFITDPINLPLVPSCDMLDRALKAVLPLEHRPRPSHQVAELCAESWSWSVVRRKFIICPGRWSRLLMSAYICLHKSPYPGCIFGCYQTVKMCVTHQEKILKV